MKPDCGREPGFPKRASAAAKPRAVPPAQGIRATDRRETRFKPFSRRWGQSLREDTETTMTDQLSLVKGTLDVLVLKTLSWGAMHGFEITSWLEDRSGGSLDVEDSALYQALHRLEERGLISAEWGMTENNRRARYYSVTRSGRAHLRAETTRWLRYTEMVSDILGAATRTA